MFMCNIEIHSIPFIPISHSFFSYIYIFHIISKVIHKSKCEKVAKKETKLKKFISKCRKTTENSIKV